jgi:hypothetical protein
MTYEVQQMTVADWIRNMTDEELAAFITALLSERDHVMSEKLDKQGIPNSLIEIPVLSVSNHLKYLQSEMEGE